MPGTMSEILGHLAIINSAALGNSPLWAESDLFVLKHQRKQARTIRSDILVLATRLVIYFNLGTHHAPTTQDIPNTLIHTSGSGVMFGYSDSDISGRYGSSVSVDNLMFEKMASEPEMRQQMGFSN